MFVLVRERSFVTQAGSSEMYTDNIRAARTFATAEAADRARQVTQRVAPVSEFLNLPHDDQKSEIRIVTYRPAEKWVSDVYVQQKDGKEVRQFCGSGKDTKGKAIAEAADWLSMFDECQWS